MSSLGSQLGEEQQPAQPLAVTGEPPHGVFLAEKGAVSDDSAVSDEVAVSDDGAVPDDSEASAEAEVAWAPDAAWEAEDEQAEDESINFDSDPLLEVTLDGVEYRLDVGKQGTALSVSARGEGEWHWKALAEAKWDGLSLRAKELPRQLREQLARALTSLGDD